MTLFERVRARCLKETGNDLLTHGLTFWICEELDAKLAEGHPEPAQLEGSDPKL